MILEFQNTKTKVGEGLAGLPARLAAHVQAAGLLLGVAEGVGVADGGGRAATRGVANARRGGLEEGRPELDFIHFIASSRPSVGFCEVDLVPLVVLPGELWFLLVTVHDRRVGRGAHRVRPGGEDAVVGPPVVGLRLL